MKVYQILTTQNLIINVFASNKTDAIKEIRESGYTIVSITYIGE